MFLENERPRSRGPRGATLALLLAGLGHLGLVIRTWPPGAPLWLALGVALVASARQPLRSEAALLAVTVGDLAALLLVPLGAAPRLVLGATVVLAGFLLARAWREARTRSEVRYQPLLEILKEALNQHGESLLELSRRSPVLLVCLRHFGCTFCREALARLGREQGALAAQGTRLVLVHQSPDAEALEVLQGYGLEAVDRISDPRRWLYFHLGLRRGGPWQLLGFKVWLRALGAGLLKRHGLGRVTGDPRQMPGVFLLRDGVVLAAYVHRTAADNPDYQALARCPN